jgi:hypothetical protein
MVMIRTLIFRTDDEPQRLETKNSKKQYGNTVPALIPL